MSGISICALNNVRSFANSIRFSSNIAAIRAGNNGRVIVIEPEKQVRSRLVENVRLNNLENVTVLGCGVGSENGPTQLFHVDKHNDGGATLRPDEYQQDCEGEDTELVTLETLVTKHHIQSLNIVKMDVEGAEVDILKGGCDVLERFGQEFSLWNVLTNICGGSRLPATSRSNGSREGDILPA